MNPFSLKGTPPGIKWLLAINIAVYLLQNLGGAGEWLVSTFGLIPSNVIGLEIWRLFTYQFLHAGIGHIVFNLLALWMFGKELEWSWGTKEFLKFYFTCVLGAGVLNTLLQPLSHNPTIGASGGIYGLLVAFAVVYPEAIIYLYFTIPMQAKHFAILIGCVEFLASYDSSHSHIARFAHLGGMFTGYFYLKSYEFRSRWDRLIYRVLDLFVSRKPSTKPKREIRLVKSREDLVKEVDRILEKVLRYGAGSLTDQEKEVMRRYSSKKH